MPRCRRFTIGLLAIASLVLAFPGGAQAAPDCSRALFAGTDSDGIGGTGFGGDQDGIGGTGHSGGEDGIGGTGFGGDEDGIGGTGVFGTVTALGSVCVNGIEIDYSPDVPFTVGGAPARLAGLGVGHVVWVVAARSDAGFTARSIELVFERVGRVEAIDVERRLVRVADETIAVLPGAVIRGVPGGSFAFQRGNTIAVSGLRHVDGRIAASRIDPAFPNSRATPARVTEWVRASSGIRWFSLEGYLGAGSRPEGRTLSGLRLDLTAFAGDPGRPGDRVWVRGVLDGDSLRVQDIVPRPEAELDAGNLDAIEPDLADAGGADEPEDDDSKDDGTKVDESRDSDRLLEPEAPEIREIPELHEIRDVPLDTDRLDVFDGGRR